METEHWNRLPKNQPAEIMMVQISEVQEAPAFNGRRSFLTLRGKRSKKVSDQIRNAIETSGVSRYKIAQHTGIDNATLSRFMGGTGGMTVETLDKLAEYLGLRIVFDGKPKDGSK